MHWRFPKLIDENFKNSFPEYSPTILQILSNRNLNTQKAIDEFFNPDYDEDIHSPFLMKGIKEAVERIRKAIDKKEKIYIYGDYDADGVTATAIVYKTLVFLGAVEPGVYIPDRAKEGYGLKDAAINYIKDKGADLIVTVDCGVANYKSVKYANEKGLEVVITDHHWVPEKLPEAVAVVNPKQPGDVYPFKNLAGVGVAFKLVQALLRDEKGNSDTENIKFEKWLLDLVAIGTVADSVSLLGENRTLVRYGFIVLSKTKNLGLGELMNNARVKTIVEGSEDDELDMPCSDHKDDLCTKKLKRKKINFQIDSDTISFQIAPRINAAGRMDHANTAYRLLVTESPDEARELVKTIEENNRSRQNVTDKIVNSVKSRITSKKMEKVIFEGDKDWPIGILGLAASRICDEFSRPTIIYCENGEESGGSGRSIESFNLIETISICKDILLEFGGHKGAAGFKVLNKNREEFRERMIKLAADIKEEDLIPSINIDAILNLDDFDWSLWEEMGKLFPYGEENPEPIFVFRDLIIEEIRRVGNTKKHLKLCLKTQGAGNGECKMINAIAFNFEKFAPVIKLGDKIDVAFSLVSNNWNGYKNLEMKIADIKISGNDNKK